jgi:hypothetical protein
VKEKMPPSEVCLPTATSLLGPPVLKPGEPYYGDVSCIVEEEIPPSWQLTDAGKESITVEDDGIGKGDEGSHFANHLVEEHLEVLFDIC